MMFKIFYFRRSVIVQPTHVDFSARSDRVKLLETFIILFIYFTILNELNILNTVSDSSTLVAPWSMPHCLSSDRGISKHPPVLIVYLQDLSIKFKNRIALPLVHSVKAKLDLRYGFESLLGLPNEMLLYIFRKMGCGKSLLNLEKTCVRLSFVLQHQGLWKHRFSK